MRSGQRKMENRNLRPVSLSSNLSIVLRTLICASVCRQVLGAQVGRSAFEERVTPLVPGASPTKFDGGAPNFDGRSGVRHFLILSSRMESFWSVRSRPLGEKQGLSYWPARILPLSHCGRMIKIWCCSIVPRTVWEDALSLESKLYRHWRIYKYTAAKTERCHE
jgi:hypothetical protein